MGDAEKGKILFRRICGMCHTVEENGKHKIGPNLHDIIGKTCGTAQGFQYTEGMKKKEVVWNETTLDKYLEAPNKFIPGTKMVFVGLKKPEDRKDLIAYLLTLK